MSVDMYYYLSKVLSEHNNLQDVAGQGPRDSFMVDKAPPVLNEESRKAFHTCAAKLLYLSKRARLDGYYFSSGSLVYEGEEAH